MMHHSNIDQLTNGGRRRCLRAGALRPRHRPKPACSNCLYCFKGSRDFHVEVTKALYSLPQRWIGQYVDVPADSEFVDLCNATAVVKAGDSNTTLHSWPLRRRATNHRNPNHDGRNER